MLLFQELGTCVAHFSPTPYYGKSPAPDTFWHQESEQPSVTAGRYGSAAARVLMAAEPERNMPTPLRDQNIQRAIDSLDDHKQVLEALARKRSELLLEDHRRVREAAQGRGEYRVTPSLPVDVMGVFVLIPA